MKRFFISDLHFSDERYDILVRPFSSLEEQHNTIINNWNKVVGEEDEVYVLGDVSIDDIGLNEVRHLNGRKILIKGNYDTPRNEEILRFYFDVIHETGIELEIQGKKFYLNHYPEKAKSDKFNLVGHVHGTWRIQKNMINVSVEAWNYTPVSETQILNCLDAIEIHYDTNVFAGELYANIPFSVIYTGEPINIVGPSLFLAGPTPRDSNTESWRKDFIEELKSSGFRGTIITPEPKVFIDHYDYDKQVEWENEGLIKADLIIFWVPRDLNNMPGFTTNIEFGEWMKSGKCVLGYPTNAPKMNYLDYKARKYAMPVFHTTKDVCDHVVSFFNKD